MVLKLGITGIHRKKQGYDQEIPQSRTTADQQEEPQTIKSHPTPLDRNLVAISVNGVLFNFAL